MFAIRLKELREQAGFSQAVLARKLGVRQSTVGMWENGKNKPQNSKLEMMASSVPFLLSFRVYSCLLHILYNIGLL